MSGGKTLYLLFESASGFALLEAKPLDAIGMSIAQVQDALTDLASFSKLVTLAAFSPFASAADALNQINSVSEGLVTDSLKNFLELNLPKSKAGKKPKYQLGIVEPKLGATIADELSIPCTTGEYVSELLRGVRTHLTRFISQLEDVDLHKAQLGLSHSYSRAKVKFNINRVDNMIIQAISLLDTLDKDVNTFVMRVREWYSWHFPELVKIVSDNYQYVRVAKAIQDKSEITDDKIEKVKEILQDDEKASAVFAAAKSSMGQDISAIDLVNIETFASRVIHLAEYRASLYSYLLEKMHTVAPNLSTLIGEVVGARLISHAGSLTNLAKYPASTVQILGAEKALFRALKTKSNTPKYGLIYHSSFIGRAQAKNKGRISRYLANKCSIASRIDCFAEATTTAFGEKLKEQVEERLSFYDTGAAPRKNVDVMKAAADAAAEVMDVDNDDDDDDDEDKELASPAETPKDKKKKKKKNSTSKDESKKSDKGKKKKRSIESTEETAAASEADTPKQKKAKADESKKDKETKAKKKAKKKE